jgi:hypothetical protein
MGKTTFGQTTTVGAILGMDADKPTLELFKDANNSFIFNDSGLDIKTDTLVASGSSITLATPKMFLGATGSAYISASLGQMEISSSNFQLKPGGDVIMSGKVTAESGEIGGFLIGANAISSSLTSKRGLILEPGESIRGYGNEVHSTKSAPGLFSFGVQAVAPPASTKRAFKSTTGLANTNAGGGYSSD